MGRDTSTSWKLRSACFHSAQYDKSQELTCYQIAALLPKKASYPLHSFVLPITLPIPFSGGSGERNYGDRR